MMQPVGAEMWQKQLGPSVSPFSNNISVVLHLSPMELCYTTRGVPQRPGNLVAEE